MNFNLIFFVLLFNTITTLIHCEIVIDGQPATTEFRVLDSSTFELYNKHRTNGKLKFRLQGVEISKVHRTASPVWHVALGDGHDMTISHSEEKDSTTKYEFTWHGVTENVTAKGEHGVCFDYAFNGAVWYQTFLEHNQTKFPMEKLKPIASPTLLEAEFSDNTIFGPLVEHMFYNTDGFALQILSYSHWFISRNEHEFCISIREHPTAKQIQQNFYFTRIDFAIVMANNTREAHHSSVFEYRLGSRPLSGHPDARMYTDPIWNLRSQLQFPTDSLDQFKVLDLAKTIQQHGFTNSQLIVDDHWQRHYGDLSFDSKKFPDPKKLTTELHQLGHRLKLLVHPFVSNDSFVLQEFPEFLLKDGATEKPLSINWRRDQSGSLYDLSYESEGYQHFHQKLAKLRKDFGVDSFRFDVTQLGSTTGGHISNGFVKDYLKSSARFGGMTELEAGISTQEYSIFVRMFDIEPSWDGLWSMVNNALTMSIAGYSFVIAPVFKSTDKFNKPPEELYIRWVQACTFLPAMQFSTPPWVYSEKVVNLTKKFVNLHREHAQTMMKLSDETAWQGKPLIRPMWYLAPDDAKTYKISNQFAIGNDLLVAPILVQGQTVRTVYLPTSGEWIDQRGKSHTGPGEIKIDTPIEELAYFKRKN